MRSNRNGWSFTKLSAFQCFQEFTRDVQIWSCRQAQLYATNAIDKIMFSYLIMFIYVLKKIFFSIIYTQTPRSLEYRNRTQDPSSATKKIHWSCTFGSGYEETKKQVSNINKILETSFQPIWQNLNLQVVPRRAPNLQDLLFRRKSL